MIIARNFRNYKLRKWLSLGLVMARIYLAYNEIPQNSKAVLSLIRKVYLVGTFSTPLWEVSQLSKIT